MMIPGRARCKVLLLETLPDVGAGPVEVELVDVGTAEDPLEEFEVDGVTEVELPDSETELDVVAPDEVLVNEVEGVAVAVDVSWEVDAGLVDPPNVHTPLVPRGICE